MGVVFEAEQEKPVHRKVALKLIKWGMDTKAVIARFESERQALALMNHPNIASVYDAGATEQGRPYFAMELVHGEPLTEYCDKHRLTVRERLELLIQVCEGVQHAHQKGIIHRDLKPSNVLVTIKNEKMVPKIIDFGVAKATSQRLTEKTVYTELGQLIGTPEYMSPEQAEMTGLDVDTRTDVYSLGVVLYELLVGAQPYDATELRRAGFDGLRRKIREEEPPKPSTRLSRLGETSSTAAKNRRVELRTLERELRGDLDWITMKALEKDRTRRYGSASELAADIHRHLENQPVLARAPSAAYRLGKFVRRHRVGVAAAMFASLALLLGITGITVGLIRATRAERVSSEEASKAKAINAFLQEVLGSGNPRAGLGLEATIINALDSSMDRISDSFYGQPEIEAAVRNTVGLTYMELGRIETAEAQLQSALQIRRQILPGNHPDIAESLNSLARLAFRKLDHAYAETLLQEAVTVGRTLEGDDRLELVDSLQHSGFLMIWKQDYEAARDFNKEALSLAREVAGDDSKEVQTVLHNLGVVAEYEGDLRAAESAYREALATPRKDPIDHATTLNNLGWVLHGQGNDTSAEKYFRDSLAISEKVRGKNHPATLSEKRCLAIVLVALGRFEEAKELLRDARALTPEKWEKCTPGIGTTRSVIDCCFRGALLTHLGQYQRAEQILLDALAFSADRWPGDHPLRLRALDYLADLYEAWGKPEKATEYRAMLEETEGPR
jgi:tetratricopeptide (TPR) repeat protein